MWDTLARYAVAGYACRMPAKVVKQKGKYRVTESGTGRVMKAGPGAKAGDGGGHKKKKDAARQARAINANLRRRGKI